MIENLLIGIFTILIGLVMVFMGYGVWRVALVIGGFVVGYNVGIGLVAPEQWFLALILGIALAVIVALAAYFLWSISILMGGIVYGAALGSGAALALGLREGGLIALAFAVIGGIIGLILAAAFKDLFIVGATAFAGAVTVFNGIAIILPFLTFITAPTGIISTIIAVVLIGGLAVIGFLTQVRLYSARYTGTYYFEERTA